jgi:hypothetical protein
MTLTQRSAAGAALVAFALLTLAAQTPPAKHRLADFLQQKIDHLRENGARPNPDSKPTVFTDDEVDDYMASGRLKVPAGISDIHLNTTSGLATATARIDFDELVKEQRSLNPLWGIFTGVHEVRGIVAAEGHGGTATIHVREIDFDGHEIPRIALEFFLERFIKPKVPNAGLDTSFKMPARIDSAVLGYHKVTFIQK